MKTMFDSVTASNIPTDAELVAGYDNGRYRWTLHDWQRFTHADLVHIQIYIPGFIIGNYGDVLDVEASDAPHVVRSEIESWCRQRTIAGVWPTIYTSKSGMSYVGGLQADYWLADPSPIPHVLPGTVATQWHYPGPYDVSEVVDGWPRTHVPQPLPQPSLIYHGTLEDTTVALIDIPIPTDSMGDGDARVPGKFLAVSSIAVHDKYDEATKDTDTVVIPVGSRHSFDGFKIAVKGSVPNSRLIAQVLVSD